MAKINLGILGMSDGNGHPYSWSAIFNGYNHKEMSNCPFPVIPEYLNKQNYPNDFLSQLGEVTHIWTQDISVTRHIANASNIRNIVGHPEEMIGKVDAVILARDDANNHLEMAKPFIEAELPIFIDKPFALSVNDAVQMWQMAKYDNQIFTCSSLRFAKELYLSHEELISIGNIIAVEGTIMKNWSTYSIHLLEPIISQIKNRGKLVKVNKVKRHDLTQVLIEWENVCCYLKTTGNINTDLVIEFIGEKGIVKKTFQDTFSCFRASLEYFIQVIHKDKNVFDKNETLELVKIIETGL
jgi:predicted dehydrogenase